MCGIYGHMRIHGTKNSAKICLDGLKKLEYRGYDSSGIAGFCNGSIFTYKKMGKVRFLDEYLHKHNVRFNLAIAHTRWATHGKIDENHAHPQMDFKKDLAIVHNGIIENYSTLKQHLQSIGIPFTSETDTEIICQLIAMHYAGNLASAVMQAMKQLQGSFSFACIHKNHDNFIIAATTQYCPLAIGICQETQDVFLSSDSRAFIGEIFEVFYLHGNECVLISPRTVQVWDQNDRQFQKKGEIIRLQQNDFSKNGYKHFLLKEIYEQPKILEKICQDRINLYQGTAIFDELFIDDDLLRKIDKIIILACGSSYHAGQVGKSLIETYAHIPTTVEIASEFYPQKGAISNKTTIIVISQSGETADILKAIQEIEQKLSCIIAICNNPHSSLSRISSSTIWLHAGLEISVCSTKTFTSQVMVLTLLAIKLGRLHLTINKSEGRSLLTQLQKVPQHVTETLYQDSIITKFAKKYCTYKHFLLTGRSYMHFIANEVALKLMEITYVQASSFPSGEMKHGPIALISPEFITLAFCGNEHAQKKLLHNLMEIKTRGGTILAFAPKEMDLAPFGEDIIILPSPILDSFAPIIYCVAGQLFAYRMAESLQLDDVDRPRNLAKSVTVE